jgi:hypothetical protein
MELRAESGATPLTPRTPRMPPLPLHRVQAHHSEPSAQSTSKPTGGRCVPSPSKVAGGCRGRTQAVDQARLLLRDRSGEPTLTQSDGGTLKLKQEAAWAGGRGQHTRVAYSQRLRTLHGLHMHTLRAVWVPRSQKLTDDAVARLSGSLWLRRAGGW